MKAIETRYKGYRFRSRLEARWAVFFDTLGVFFEYEREGYDLGMAGWYLPDFWLPYHLTWIEVKGSTPTTVEYAKVEQLVSLSGKALFLPCGVPGSELLEIVLPDHKTPYPFRIDRFRADDPIDYWQIAVTPSQQTERQRDDIMKAYIAAQSARFEHGETQ